MPLNKIDYSNTIIYKIVCKDLDVKCCYTGYTTNLTERKTSHKSDCNNETGTRYNYKVYQTIRANGGFENWSIIQIEVFPCNNRNEAGSRERVWYEILNSNMNTCVPSRSGKEWYQDNKEAIKKY